MLFSIKLRLFRVKMYVIEVYLLARSSFALLQLLIITMTVNHCNFSAPHINGKKDTYAFVQMGVRASRVNGECQPKVEIEKRTEYTVVCHENGTVYDYMRTYKLTNPKWIKWKFGRIDSNETEFPSFHFHLRLFHFPFFLAKWVCVCVCTSTLSIGI